MDQPVTVGRIVHYVLKDGPNKGTCRPAIVVRVWSDTCVNLQVFTDGTEQPNNSNDCLPSVMWVTSALRDDVDHGLHTWHFPQLVEG
jgi:hypothetical protein